MVRWILNNALSHTSCGERSKRSCVAFLTCVTLFSSTAFAQTKTFTNDQAVFLTEVSAMLIEADKKEGKPFIEQVFTPAWNSTYFSAAQRVEVVEVANYMLKKRFEAFPNFKDYFAAIAAFQQKGRSAQQFDAWMAGLKQMVQKGKKQDLASLLETSTNLLNTNTLYKSASTQWTSSAKEFSFVFDSVPKIVFATPMDLSCLAKGDSAVIHATTGIYYPAEEIWRGKAGRITWERAGLKPQATYADWDHPYEVKLKSAALEVDTVRFTDAYFDRTLIGKVSDKVLANVDKDNASYPRFESYDRRMKIRDIVDGIDFEGGFSMRGAKLEGYGTSEEPAYLTFYRDKRPFIVTSGLVYSIEPQSINSEDVSVRIMLDKDSIYHPSVSLRFLKEKKQLSLIKKDEGLSKAPFYDTYHLMDMYFEALYWKQGDPVVEFGSLQGSTQLKASFESFDYFKRKRYDAMLGIDMVHPLVRIRDYQKQHGDVFTAKEFAVFTKLQMDQVVPMLIDLSNKGYLDFDSETQTATIKPRLRQHILASAGKVDYDVLQFNSTVEEGVNASLNLLNYDLSLKGVARIVLSDSQDVRIFPKEKLVTIKKGRDFTFGGMVQAGKLQFYGHEYYFHYDPFVIDLLNVDSVAFNADSFEKDEHNETHLVRVKNVLEKVTGTLELDQPTNKSGLLQKDYPQFPKFNSTQESFVFYDRKAIQRGVYNRDKFYYRSDPFMLDSLDNFTNAGLYFPGTLVSAGIFPDIKEPLGLQPDYALGFVRQTGEGGMPLYGKKAKFGNTITLNYRGLQGDGDFTYLTTIATSKRFIFCPDSTFGATDTLYNAASVTAKVPNVHVGRVFMRLEPAKDMLLAEKLKEPMVMYDGQAFLHGKTELTPNGMTGAGLVDYTNATLYSRFFQFETMKTHADTSDFRLTEGDTSSIAFKTDNVNATIKLDERVGDFVSNGSETKVEFPVNQYICYMDRFKWYMDAGDISLESDRTAAAGGSDLQLSGPNFISVRPDQDSLSFMAPKARYDLKKHLITADEVLSIPVADALIAPDSARVRIRKDAVMDPLNNAVITANFVTRYHSIYNASVNLKAKRNYSAVGDIDYVDENQGKRKIHLESINVDTTFQTYARGRITEEEAFLLSPFFEFYGEVDLQASIKELEFKGNTRIQHGCSGLDRAWMGFKGRIDPLQVQIPVGDSLLNGQGDAVGTGLFLTQDDPFRMYGTFLTKKRDRTDRTIISAKGLLTYDKAKKEYVISNKEKLLQRTLPGDLVSLNVDNCEISADGRIGTGMDFGRVTLTDVGTLKYYPGSDSTVSSVTMMADFYFYENALEKMAEAILTYPDQKQVDITKTNYERSLREVLGLERSDKLISDLSLKGEIKKLPDELQKSITFCDLKLRWSKEEGAWVSTGMIGVGSILKKPIFRYMKGKVKLERVRSGDKLTIALQLDDQTWWFFTYARGYLYACSSDQEFNTMLSELKEDKTKLESKKDEPAYQYGLMVGGKTKFERFRNDNPY